MSVESRIEAMANECIENMQPVPPVLYMSQDLYDLMCNELADHCRRVAQLRPDISCNDIKVESMATQAGSFNLQCDPALPVDTLQWSK